MNKMLLIDWHKFTSICWWQGNRKGAPTLRWNDPFRSHPGMVVAKNHLNGNYVRNHDNYKSTGTFTIEEGTTKILQRDTENHKVVYLWKLKLTLGRRFVNPVGIVCCSCSVLGVESEILFGLFIWRMRGRREFCARGPPARWERPWLKMAIDGGHQSTGGQSAARGRWELWSLFR